MYLRALCRETDYFHNYGIEITRHIVHWILRYIYIWLCC